MYYLACAFGTLVVFAVGFIFALTILPPNSKSNNLIGVAFASAGLSILLIIGGIGVLISQYAGVLIISNIELLGLALISVGAAFLSGTFIKLVVIGGAISRAPSN